MICKIIYLPFQQLKANGRIFAKCNGDYANRGEFNIPCMTCYEEKTKNKKICETTADRS